MKTLSKIGLLAIGLIFLNSCSKGSFGDACYEEQENPSERIHFDIDWNCKDKKAEN